MLDSINLLKRNPFFRVILKFLDFPLKKIHPTNFPLWNQNHLVCNRHVFGRETNVNLINFNVQNGSKIIYYYLLQLGELLQQQQNAR